MTTIQGECNSTSNANGLAMLNSVGGNSCEIIENSTAGVGMRSTTSSSKNVNNNTQTPSTNNTSGYVNQNSNSAARNNWQRSNSNTNGQNQNNNNNNTNNINTISGGGETAKRKKLKSRNASLPNNGSAYAKDHLDAWLETCLKDASNAQLSSSSEFLDYNPTPTSLNNGKNYLKQQHQQTYAGMQNSQFLQGQHQHQQQHQQQHIQQQFAMRSNSQTPAAYAANSGGPFSQGFQRNFMKHSGSSYSNRYSHMFPNTNVSGGVGGGGGSYYAQNDAQDFASLPPLVNLLGNSTEMEQNSSEVLDGSSSNPNISRGFRFSDPCLLNPSDNDSKISGQNTPDRRVPSDMDNNNNKFFNALMDQINILHETNSKICRNLHETKVDIEALKHAPTWGLRHRRDSLSGLSTHSQPMVFGGGFGTQSPAPTFHSGAYTPGIMTDVVREVKEAARVREDALLNKVKSMVEERQWSTNEYNLRIMRDIEELKSQIQHMRIERKEANKRISHLETENKYMRQMLSSIINARSSEKMFENEVSRARKPFPVAHRRGSQPLLKHGSLDEQDETASLHMLDTTPSTTSTIDVAAAAENGNNSTLKMTTKPTQSRNSSVSSSDSERINFTNGSSGTTHAQTHAGSPPSFTLITATIEAPKRKKDIEKQQQQQQEQMEIEQQQHLRRELNAAMVARKEADKRIIALETLVKTLTVNNAQTVEDRNSTITSNGVGETNTTNNLLINAGGGNSHDINTTCGTIRNQKQHQQQQQLEQNVVTKFNKLQQQHHAIVGNNKMFVPQHQQQQHQQVKLSVAGPITDL